MSTKKLIYVSLLSPILTKSIKLSRPLVNIAKDSLDVFKNFNKRGSTGNFFKKINFFVLSVYNLTLQSGRFLKMKSLVFALWNTLATYNIIF